VLAVALEQAARSGRIQRNVARLVGGPKVERYKIKPLSADHARALLGALYNHRLEVLGLQWDDLDLANETLIVRRALQRLNGKLTLTEPKSEASSRTLALPAVLVTMLKAHQRLQAEERQAAVRAS
jgi:integrase